MSQYQEQQRKPHQLSQLIATFPMLDRIKAPELEIALYHQQQMPVEMTLATCILRGIFQQVQKFSLELQLGNEVLLNSYL